jgi:hypothetical protein
MVFGSSTAVGATVGGGGNRHESWHLVYSFGFSSRFEMYFIFDS